MKTKQNTLQAGDTAPDFSLSAADGGAVSLPHLLEAGNNLLLVFLRHLG